MPSHYNLFVGTENGLFKGTRRELLLFFALELWSHGWSGFFFRGQLSQPDVQQPEHERQLGQGEGDSSHVLG